MYNNYTAEIIKVGDFVLDFLHEQPHTTEKTIRKAIHNEPDLDLKYVKPVLLDLYKLGLIENENTKTDILITLSAKGFSFDSFSHFLDDQLTDHDKIDKLLIRIDDDEIYAMHKGIPDDERKVFEKARRYGLVTERSKNTYVLSESGQRSIDLGGFQNWYEETYGKEKSKDSKSISEDLQLIKEQLKEMTQMLVTNKKITTATGEVLFNQIDEMAEKLDKPSDLKSWFLGKIIECAVGLSLEGGVTKVIQTLGQ